MVITDVKLFLTQDSGPKVFVKIETDEGISGFGEATIFFMPQAVYGLLQDLKPYLIGEDPERIEHIWQICYRSLFYRGGPVTGAAVAGIDMALWDIKGKKYGAPVYQLLGGLSRDKVLLYGQIKGTSPSDAAKQAADRVAMGIKYIRYRGFTKSDKENYHDHRAAVEETVESLAEIRKTIGYDTGIIIECHGRFEFRWAVELAERVREFQPLILEDPVRHENPMIYSELKSRTNIPVATGERYHSKWEFREIINGRYVDYIRPDICHCGGITEFMKIAAMAEANYIKVIPHNNASPLGTAATIHAALAAPNIEMVEAPFVNKTEHNYTVTRPFPAVKDGYALPSDKPGLGVEFDEALAEETKAAFMKIPKLKGPDGSVQDF